MISPWAELIVVCLDRMSHMVRDANVIYLLSGMKYDRCHIKLSHIATLPPFS